jgi:2-keto-3-deoxy-L-fuconate dehydrogenase
LVQIDKEQIMRFSGKTALVTGAAGGIGQAIVAGLRAEGAGVATADRDSSAIAGEAHLDGDLLNPKYCDGLITATVATLGLIDIIVNNTGVITRGTIDETTDADWALYMGVNVEAPFRTGRTWGTPPPKV